MAQAGPDRAMLDVRKNFQTYRGDPVQTDQEIMNDLANTDYVNPAAVPAGVPALNLLPARPRRRPPRARGAAAQLIVNNFLAMNANSLPIPNTRLFGGGPVNVSCLSLSFLSRGYQFPG